MKKALSILLLLCMTIATIFVSSCGKTNTETTTTAATVTPEEKMSPAERAANEIIDEIMQGIILLPEKRDEGVYKEEKYGMEYTYEYGKDRNIKRVRIKGISVQNFEYDKNGRLTDIYAQSDEESEVKSTGHMTFKYTPSGRFAEVNSIARYNHEGTEEELSTKAIFEYDEKGRVVKNEIFQNEKSVQNIEIKYDEKARTITMEGERQFSYDSIYKRITTYDEDWKMIKEEGFDKNEKLIHLSEYDKNGNETKSISYDENGEVKSYTAYEYDEKGNLIKEASYDAAGALQVYYVYEYDEDGYILKETRYDANDVKRSCTEYFENTTNENKYFSGKERRSESYSSDGSLSGITEYNRNGNVVKAEQYISGKLYAIKEMEYDESGNLIKSSSYDADRKFTGYSVYGYNESGKRIKISEYDGDDKLTGYTEIKRNGDYILSETVYDGDGNKTEYTEYLENTSDYNTYSRKKRYEEYKNGKLAELEEYNENGEITKQISYDGEGNKKLYEEYVTLKVKHNGHEGTTTVTKTREIYNNAKLESRTEYEYDENGNRTKISEYDGDGKLTEYTEAKYDGERILSETVYDGDGNKTMYMEYITLKVKHNGYEGTTTVTKTRETYNDGKLEHRTEYEYDENGNRTKISEYDGDGKLTEYTEAKYDGERILSESRYDGNGKLIRRTEDEYDENGKKLKSSVYNNGGLEGYKSYHYDESGRLIKVTACDAYNRIVNYYEIEYTDEYGNGKTHEYDKNGNLLGTYPWVIFR